MCTGNPWVSSHLPQVDVKTLARQQVDYLLTHQVIVNLRHPCTVVVIVRVYAICRCSSVNHCRCRSCVYSYCSCVCSRHCSSVIVCHATDGDMAPSSCVKEGEGERSRIAHLDCVDGDNDMGITIHLSMDGRVSRGGD